MPRTSRHCNRLGAARRFQPASATVAAFIDSALVRPRAGLADAAATAQMADDFRSMPARTRDDLLRLGWTGQQLDRLSMAAIVTAQRLEGAAL